MTDTPGVSGPARNHDLFVLLIVLLVWIPVPVASNRGWSVAILEAAALLIFGVWALRYAHKPFAIPIAVRELRVPLAILLGWLCVPLIQIVPIPVWFGQIVSSGSESPYANLLVLPTSSFHYLTVDRSASLSGFLRQCALVAVFFSVLSLASTRSRLRVLLILVFIVGFAEALYGLVLYLGGDGFGLWDPGHKPETVSGTYVNQNHFAGLMEMSIAAGMGVLLMGWKAHESVDGLRSSFRLILSLIFGRRGLVLFGLLVLLAALILSTSRGAIGSIAVALVVAVCIAATRKGRGRSELGVGVTSAILVVLAVVWLGAGQMSDKLESSGLTSNRGDLRELSYQIISDNPIIGSGTGTYRWVLPRYKDARFGSGFYEHAHNDYLETLGEQGALGFSLLIIAIGLIVVRILKSYRMRHDPVIQGALFASVVGCGSILLHGLVDFNLQIPANAAYFCVLLGIGSVAATATKESTQ